MHPFRLVLAACLVVPLLAGCEDPQRVGLERRLQTLVGGNEGDLVRRMGAAPTRITEQGGIRYVSWMFHWPEQAYGSVAVLPSQPTEAERTSRFCETTFAVEQGRVAGYSLRGDWCGWSGYPRVAPA